MLSEVTGVCGQAHSPERVQGTRHTEGLGKSEAQGGRYLSFIGLGDPLKAVRVMLVI